MRSIPERSGVDKAYGETRYTWGTTPTDYRFTGQRQTESLGLYHMGARWYDPYLGQWLSPDSIVPEPGNPQSLNRNSYTRNNPLKFRDPSGHMEIYGGSFAPYSDYWHTYVNPKAPGCQSDLEFIKQGASLAVDFTPGLGDAKGLAEVFTGKDLITGESLGAWRFLGLVGLSELRYLRHADKAGETARLIFTVADTGEAVGQWHHVFSNKVMRAIGDHQVLSGVFKRNDVLLRAFDEASHKGYQTWHRTYDDEVVRWLRGNPLATEQQFLEYLLEFYGRPEMLEKFPGGEELLKQMLEALISTEAQ